MQQEENIIIPLHLLADLRCYNCNKFISCGPVHVVLDRPDGSLLCGRCPFWGNYSVRVFHNKAFEYIASMFTYPCCYWENYCSTSLPWNASLDHEFDCSYRSCCSRFWRHPCGTLCSGVRELPFGDIKIFNINKQLLNYLRCVLCDQYLSCDPVYMQSDGRNICHRCVYSNGIPKDCIRNIGYETIACVVNFSCIYSRWGCPSRVKFGRDLWQHEAKCPYRNTPEEQTPMAEESFSIKPRPQPQPQPQHQAQPQPQPQHQAQQPAATSAQNSQQKNKGVIKTHSGHIWGTISPMSLPFAPPTEMSQFDTNKELIKSMKKREERRFTRAEDIENQIDRLTGESESVCTEDSYKFYDQNSYNRWEDYDRQPQQHQKTNPQRRDSGYSTPNRPQTLHSQAIPHPYDVTRNSFQYPTTAVGTHDPRINQPRRSLLKRNGQPSPEPFALHMEDIRVQNAVNLSRTESMNSNKDLMMELRKKQQQRMKNNGAIWESPSQ